MADLGPLPRRQGRFYFCVLRCRGLKLPLDDGSQAWLSLSMIKMPVPVPRYYSNYESKASRPHRFLRIAGVSRAGYSSQRVESMRMLL